MMEHEKKLVIFAQLGEASAFIQETKAEVCTLDRVDIWGEGKLPCLYQFSEGWIALCGVGIHGAQMCAAKYGHLADEIWNLGICGSLNSDFPLDRLIEIQTVGKYTPLSQKLDSRSKECLSHILPPLHLSSSGAKLVSSDFPLFDPFHRQALCEEWELVDMEGYGIAYAAKELQKPVRIWKVVSDFAKPEERAAIQQKKAALSKKLAEYLFNMPAESETVNR